jgi:hypothetical protein
LRGLDYRENYAALSSSSTFTVRPQPPNPLSQPSHPHRRIYQSNLTTSTSLCLSILLHEHSALCLLLHPLVASALYTACSITVSTYDHRTLKIELPVRSAVLKQCTGGLVVRWVTTSEYPLLYVFEVFARSGVCSRTFLLGRGNESSNSIPLLISLKLYAACMPIDSCS